MELNSVLSILVTTIINNYYLKDYYSAIVTEENDLDYTASVPISYIRVQTNTSGKEQYSLLKDIMENALQDLVIQVTDPAEFIDIFDEFVTDIQYRHHNRKLVFLQTENTNDFREQMHETFKRHGSGYIPNMIFLILKDVTDIKSDIFYIKSDVTVDIYTIKFTGVDDSRDAVYLDTWFGINRTFVRDADLFPDKISNMEGKPITVATFSYEPLTLFWYDEEDNLVYDGIETRCAIEFCRYFNCSLVYNLYDSDKQWGEVYPNKTGNGIMGNIVEDRADIAYGSLTVWYNVYLMLDFTTMITRTSVSVLSPEPVLIEDFSMPFLPFTIDVWQTTAFTLIIITLTLALFVKDSIIRTKSINQIQADNTDTIQDHIENNTNDGYKYKGKQRYYGKEAALTDTSTWQILSYSFISVSEILLSQGGGFGGGKLGLFLRNCFLLMIFFVTNAYICGLTSTMTLPRYTKPVENAEDMAETGLLWGATHPVWVLSLLEATEPTMVAIRDNFRYMDPDKLYEKRFDNDFSFAIERLLGGNFAVGSYITEDIATSHRVLKDDIYWGHIVFAFRKSSPYFDRYNEMVHLLYASGLPIAFETQVVLQHMTFRIQQGIAQSRSQPSKEPKVLKMNHFKGTLLLWGGGVVLSTIVLLIELILKKNATSSGNNTGS